MTKNVKQNSVSSVTKKQSKNKRNIRQATYIQALLSVKQISQTQLANELNVALKSVNNVIWGLRTSKRIQEYIAHRLDFPNWLELKLHARDLKAIDDLKKIRYGS